MSNSVVFARFALTTILRSDLLSNLPNRTNTSTLACANLCGYQPTCRSFLHDSRDGRCFLKDMPLQGEEYITAKSGLKYYSKPTRVPECSLRGFTYVANGQFCYKDYMKENMNMFYAKMTCLKLGAMMLMANTEAKRRFMTKIGRKHDHKNLWIGGKRTLKVWKWIDGKPIYRTYWCKSSKHSDFSWEPQCIYYSLCDESYSWDNDDCDAKVGFMCEAPVKE